MPRAVGGLIQPTWCSASFVDVMRQLPEDFAPADYCRPDLLLHSEGRLAVYFTPFDRVNPDAKLVLVGLTPGRAQAHLALTTAAAALRHGTNLNEALDEAHRVGSFAGAMRSNMTSMFDGSGLHTALGLDSCSRLFTDRRDLLGGTSAVLYPVFIDGKNYSGSPTILRSPILRAFASQVLAAELDRTPNALIIPLGQAAADGVLLAGVEPGRVLDGFPHPFGANGHRAWAYLQRREQLTETVRAWSFH